jgi:hypothetical protein
MLVDGCHTDIGLRVFYALGLLNLTPSPLSAAGRKSIPALASAFSTAGSIPTLESSRVIAFSDTMRSFATFVETDQRA